MIIPRKAQTPPIEPTIVLLCKIIIPKRMISACEYHTEPAIIQNNLSQNYQVQLQLYVILTPCYYGPKSLLVSFMTSPELQHGGV